MTSIELREPNERDWPAILRVANKALPGAADGNAEWLANRRAFAKPGRRHRQYVAVEPDGRVMAYGAIEADAADGRYRLFAVMGAKQLAGAFSRSSARCRTARSQQRCWRKGSDWKKTFGAQVITAVVLSGVY